ncbi:MAG: nucleotide-binding protein [Bacteroidetes bacterium]|nr:nucleotide-binding protein [Bacteroidota bacterium]
MTEILLKRFEELIESGNKLVPLGGFEFSGYNARLQNTYSEWRKASLELFDLVGPIGFPYKNKVLSDSNSVYFYQTSAFLILNALKELSEKLKATPELITEKSILAQEQKEREQVTFHQEEGVTVLKPPPKKQPPQQQISIAERSIRKKVYVIGNKNEPLRVQLSEFLKELDIEEVVIERTPGKMLLLDEIQDNPDVHYAFFVVDSQDIAYIMFELGHFVGKLGNGKVMVLHMTDVQFPREVPGVTVKPIVVKLEEASLAIIKELKAGGYSINI